MKNDAIETLFTRLANLPDRDQLRAIYAMFGGCQSIAEHRPRTGIGEMFHVLDRHVTAHEAKRAATAAAA